jgi:hypothetical protein
MFNSKSLRRFKHLLVGLCLGFIVIGLSSTAAFSQAANPTPANTAASGLVSLCRQLNPATGTGMVAYSTPNTTNPIKAANGANDGPEANKAVFLTSSPPENSSDGNYVRVWFKSIDPNFKQGWIARKFSSGDSLKLGTTEWRNSNCAI